MIGFINDKILSLAVPICLFAAGAVFLFRTKFFFSLGNEFKAALFASSSSNGKESGKKALAVALAGTLGVGNIVGVADALIFGGAGALFWMEASCVFAMAVKYAETALAARHRKEKNGVMHGGALYYLRSGALRFIFAFFCVFCSLTMGSALQCKASAEAFDYSYGISPVLSGAVIAALVFAVVFGGRKRIFDLSAALVPIMTGLFVVFSLIAILKNAYALPSALRSIIVCAFNIKSASAGALVPGAMAAIRYGVLRGLLSNEAGCGTSPMAHASSGCGEKVQGALGIMEVFVDTALLCTLSAFVILTSGLDISIYDSGMVLVIDAFSRSFPTLAAPFITFSIAIFAFASIICWAFYGSECIFYYSAKKAPQKIYSIFVAVATFLGALTTSSLLFSLSDMCIGAMTLINTTSVFQRRKEIV